MIIKLDGGKLKAFQSYRYKDRLRSIGFRFSASERCWYVKAQIPVAFKLDEEFRNENIFLCDNTKILISNAKKEFKIREKEITRLKAYKQSLFDNPDAIDISKYTIPEGISMYSHQKIALDYFHTAKVGNLYGDCGVGKTAIILLLIERLIREQEVDKILVICPKSIMRGAWEEDNLKFTPKLKMCILDKGTKANKIILRKDFAKHPKYKKKYNHNYSIYVINYEAIDTLMDIIPYYGFDMLVFDEVSKTKDYKSMASKNCRKLAKHFQRRYVMSGTAAPNSELEYFTQMHIVDPLIFGDSYFKFREEWFDSSGFMGFDYTMDPMKEDAFIDKVYTHGLRFKQKDCVDLPEQQFLNLSAYMSKTLTTAYKTLEKEKILELKSKTLSVINPLAELSKLRQLANGFVLTEETKHEYHPHKLEVLKDFVEANPTEQIVIWATFVHDIEKIKELLGDKAGCLYGKTTTEELVERTRNFKTGKLQYLVCNPQSVAHGHTWTNCNINIFYSLNYSSELYEQACKRTHRIGQKQKVVYYHILSRTIDGEKTIDDVVCYTVRNKLKKSTDIMDKFMEVALGKNS